MFQDAYSETDDRSVAENNHGRTNLDTSSDASHTALLELKQELTKLGPEKAQRDLANAPC